MSPSPSISAANMSASPICTCCYICSSKCWICCSIIFIEAIVSSKQKQKQYLNLHLHQYLQNCTSDAPSALVVISAAVNVGSAAPSFSYQAIVSSKAEAEIISKSPSPSTSAYVLHHSICTCCYI